MYLAVLILLTVVETAAAKKGKNLEAAVKALQDQTAELAEANEQLKEENAGLVSQLGTMNDRLDGMATVKILGGETNTCKIICTGTVPASSSQWTQYSEGLLYITVNMSECQFNSTPIITTAGDGKYLYSVIGTSGVYEVTSAEFKMRIRGYVHTGYYSDTNKPTLSDAKRYRWSMNWVAVGYTC